MARPTEIALAGPEHRRVLSRFHVMEPTQQQQKKHKKTKRIAVSKRLSEFYAQIMGIVAVDTEDFYRRVMEQAARQERGNHAKSFS
jgi:hypothetical protein